jgi:threonine dehydrogenase-like Zn-dependent dehydrogenase
VGTAQILIAVAGGLIILRLGLGFLRVLAAPPPEPPDPGELHKVRLHYRCTICGTEVKMTVANEEDPDPPRHCMDEMEVLATED